MNDKKKKIKLITKHLLKYVLFELIALLMIVLVSGALYIGARHQVKNTNDASVFRLNETLYDYDDPVLSMREALRNVEMIETASGFDDNVSAQLIGNTDDFSLWIDGKITVLFYKENGELKVVDLKECFDESEVDRLIEIVTSEKNVDIKILKIYAEDNGTGEKDICGIEYRAGNLTKGAMGNTDESALIFDDLGDKKDVTETKIFVLPQSRKMNELLEDDEAETKNNVYTNSVLTGWSMFPGNSKYYKVHGDFPNVIFTIAFDIDRIAFEQARPQMLLSAVYIQVFAFYVMIVISNRERKREEARRFRDNFIDAMAHELKTPVAVVQNTSEYLSTGQRPEKQEHYLEVLRNESSHMNDLLNRMLAYTRVKDGSAQISLSEKNLDDLVDEVMRSYEETDVRIEREKGGAAVKCDPELLKSVIDNLISNAIKYGEHDAPVRIVTEGTRLSVWNKTASVGENGKEDLWTSMDRMELGGGGSDGSGVGLAISAVILEKHGASHKAEYKDGGVEFSFDMKGKPDPAKKIRKFNFVISIIEILIFIPLIIYWTILYMEGGQGDINSFICVCCWLLMTVFPFYHITMGK